MRIWGHVARGSTRFRVLHPFRESRCVTNPLAAWPRCFSDRQDALGPAGLIQPRSRLRLVSIAQVVEAKVAAESASYQRSNELSTTCGTRLG